MAKKSVKPSLRNQHKSAQRLQVTFRNEHFTTIEIDVVNGDLEGSVKHFVGNELFVDHSCKKNDLNAEILDSEMTSWEVVSYSKLTPVKVSAMEKGVTIVGPGDVVKDIVESLREAYDSSGTDMPKALHDLVFQLEVELGIVD